MNVWPLLEARLRRRRAVVRQYDQIDCGPAALLTVLRYWKGDSSIVHVRELCHTDARGTTMLGLVEAARALGFEADGASGDYEDLKQQEMPCIAHVIDGRLQHYVVVYEVTDSHVIIGDPAAGVRRIERSDFLNLWRTQSVVLLRPTENLLRASVPHWTRWIVAHCRREETWLYQSLFIGVMYTLLSLSTAVFVQWLVDRFIPQKDLQRIMVTGLVLLALQLTKAGAGFFRQRFLVELNRRIGVRITTDFITHLFRLPLRFFESRKTGDITSRLNDSIKIQNALLTVVGSSVIDALVILGSITFIFVLARPIGWVALATIPLYAAFMYFGTRKLPAEQREVMKRYAALESSYIDSLNGMNEVLAFNAGASFTARNITLFRDFQHAHVQLGMRQANLWLRAETVGGVLVMSSLMVSALLVLDGTLLLGQMLAAYTLLAGMLPSVHRLVDANIALQGASVAASRLLDLLLVETEQNRGTAQFGIDRKLTLDKATFVWPKGQPLLTDVSLEIPCGRITGLWGPSGSGKTTLVKILQRKYALTSGAVLVDDLPSDVFDLASYRANIAVVPETVKIFNGTILDNLLLGRTYTSMDRLQHDLAATGLADFFNRFEGGLATVIGEEGRQLSSGERQIVGLVRAMLAQPAVVVMDEGVNAIDSRIAATILSALHAYAATGRAVLIISHNPLTLMHAEYLYALEAGTISHEGRPEDLITEAGPLRDLLLNGSFANSLEMQSWK